MVAVAGGDAGWGDGLWFSSEASATVCLTWFRRRAEARSDDRLLCPATPACSANEELPPYRDNCCANLGKYAEGNVLAASAGQPKAACKALCKLKATQTSLGFHGGQDHSWLQSRPKCVPAWLTHSAAISTGWLILNRQKAHCRYHNV